MALPLCITGWQILNIVPVLCRITPVLQDLISCTPGVNENIIDDTVPARIFQGMCKDRKDTGAYQGV